MRRHATGFTLIELMVTVAIIGLLASVAVPEFSGMLAQARRADYDALFTTYHTMIVNYYRQNGQLPPGNFFYVSEPPLGGFVGDISGYANPSSPYFPGKDIQTAASPGYKLYTDDYQNEPWRSLVKFGAPTVSHSQHRFALYGFGSSFLLLYGFHNFNHDKVTGYDYEFFIVDPALPDGLSISTGSYLPNE